MAHYNPFFRIVDGRPVVTDEEGLMKHREQSWKDHEFLVAHREELLKQYPDKWVAVYQEKVVAVAPTMRGLFRKVEAQGIRRGDVKGEFLDTNPMPWIL